jgi:hypothetical protein
LMLPVSTATTERSFQQLKLSRISWETRWKPCF